MKLVIKETELIPYTPEEEIKHKLIYGDAILFNLRGTKYLIKPDDVMLIQSDTDLKLRKE